MEFPVCHLTMESLEEGRKLIYRSEGKVVLSLDFGGSGKVDYKRGSDADIQVDPPIQQLMFEAEEDCGLTVTLAASDGILLRPERAREGQAILSQSGKPLIYGVNGLYDLDSDMYITWHGIDWKFNGKSASREDGKDVIRLLCKVRKDVPVVFMVYQQYYRKHQGYEFHDPRKRRHNTSAICGWATWEACHRDVTMDILRESAGFIGRELKPYGLSYIQVDDGYQSPVMPPPGVDSIMEGWLNLNEKFPGGHESIVGTIRDAGLEPAIWLNAMINNEEYARDSGKCLVGKDGQLIKEPWIHYVFDCLEESCEEIFRLYRKLAETGYTYFKVDAIRHLIYDGLQAAVRQGLFDNGEAIRRFRNYMSAIRRGIGGENYLVSCWGMLTPNVGICDAMRFATDASASDHSFRMQVDESAKWHHTHGILYLNDPDYICLRMENGPARSIASLVSLNGYLYMISDDISLYGREKLDISRKTIPPVQAVTAETGPVAAALPTNYYKNILSPRDGEIPLSFGNLWATHFAREGRNWATVTLIRTWAGEAPEHTEVLLENLGLDPDLEYAVFDFWSQKPIGFAKDKISISIPDSMDCAVLALTPAGEGVELIGSSRHVSMDAVSVIEMCRNENGLALTLEGVEGESFDYWFAVPETGEISCSGDCVASERTGRFLKCAVKFNGKIQKLTIKNL